ncbi:MAG: GntR family transcriptional regulator [Lachnospiraceae bacterium]|nr:GntR family transcriptional regulator [Lachnospiraceae bacterium]
MNLIDWRDGRPIYEQIASNMKRLILRDVLLPGDQLPSVRSLAMENATNPNTVQKAYAELERQGFIYTVRGRGVFVADSAALKDRRRAELIDELQAVFTEAEEVGVDPEKLCRDALARRKTEGTEQ